jgi:hypothetical protein
MFVSLWLRSNEWRLSAAIAAAAGFNVCGAADKRYSLDAH